MSDYKLPQWRDHRRHLYTIARAAIKAVDPYEAVCQNLHLQNGILTIGQHQFRLEEHTRVFVVGAGKAGIAMAEAVEMVLRDRITDGVIAVPDLSPEPLAHIRLIKAGHPIPDEGSIEAGRQVKELLEQTRKEDLVLVLISGGGSALLELPVKGLHLDDLRRLNDLLIKCGAPIHKINTIRRQLSHIKGGGLGRMASPAATFTMILSDVVGDHLEAIASGPTTLSSTTAEDAWQLLGRYDLLDKVPNAVRRVIESSRISNEGDRVVSNHHAVNTIIGSNRMAAEAALVRVKEIGFRAFLLTTRLQGEARRVGQCIAAFVKSIKLDPSPNEAPICVVLGGETTVTVLGKGVGGRNQELALSAAIGLAGWKNVAVMTLATDGVDGPTPAAGAIITGETVARARVHSLDALTALKDNDSYTFFQALGDTVLLGPTGTNVNDLLFCLVYRS